LLAGCEGWARGHKNTADPKRHVADQLGLEVKSNGGRIAKEMKLEDIKGTDLERFLEQVAEIAAQGHSK
jgi:hypothetical protein